MTAGEAHGTVVAASVSGIPEIILGVLVGTVAAGITTLIARMAFPAKKKDGKAQGS